MSIIQLANFPCGQGGGQEEGEDLGPPAGTQRPPGVQTSLSAARSAVHQMEIKIKTINHSDVEGVIKYLDYYIGKDNNSFLLVMERPLLYKDLFEIISDQEYLEENAACYYFKQLVSIVINCQKQGVIHRSVLSPVWRVSALSLLQGYKARKCPRQSHH